MNPIDRVRQQFEAADLAADLRAERAERRAQRTHTIATITDSAGSPRRPATWRECASAVATHLNFRLIDGPDGGLVRVDIPALQSLAADLGATITRDASFFRFDDLSERDGWRLLAEACLERQNGGAAPSDLCWLWGRYNGDEDVDAARAEMLRVCGRRLLGGHPRYGARSLAARLRALGLPLAPESLSAGGSGLAGLVEYGDGSVDVVMTRPLTDAEFAAVRSWTDAPILQRDSI